MSTTEIFLIAVTIIFTVPYVIWRVGRTDYYAPLVVVQILTGIVLGPGVLGKLSPDSYAFVFTEPVVQSLNGIAWWAVMVFVWMAGIELDLHKVWVHRRDSIVTAGLALVVPLVLGAISGVGLLMVPGWSGPAAMPWQFVVGMGMACAVTALPVLILLIEKLGVLREPIGQRILRYASMDDIVIWCVLAVILMDWHRVGTQIGFLLTFALISVPFRRAMAGLPERDRWYAGLIWLGANALAAEWTGLHFVVGAFLAGSVMDGDWFNRKDMDMLRHHVLLIVMPVFFLSTGLRTNWSVGGEAVFIAAAALLVISVSGKMFGVHLAGRVLGWPRGETVIISWLLQTKGLIMIVFANVLLDKGIITGATFTALLLMALGSTMLTIPMVSAKLQRMRAPVSQSI